MDLTTAALAALALCTAHPDVPAAAPGPVLPASRFAAAAPAAALPAWPSGPLPAVVPPPADTAVSYSEAYYTRLTIHRWGSYAMLPLFVGQALVGQKMYRDLDTGGESDLEDLHGMLAFGVGALFTSNTVTGVWNLWEARKDPNERTRRTVHAVLMLAGDAGFLATGMLGEEAGDGRSNANTHRAVAISSMAVSTVGWLLMTDLFRR